MLIAQLKLSANALKDAQLRADDLELTGGFVTSDRNALDASAREQEARAAAARARQQEMTQKAADAERAYNDCRGQRERQQAAVGR